MDRDEVLERFCVDRLRPGIEKLGELDRFCRENRDAFAKEIERLLRKLVSNIALAQSQDRKEVIFCISLCFQRSKFILRDGTLCIFGFDKRFFLDPAPIWEEMDFSSLCSYIWELEDEMVSALPEYRNELKESDVRMIIQTDYVPLLIGYITELLRYSVRTGSSGLWDGIRVTDDFSVTAGEFQGNFDEVFVTERLDTGGRSLAEFLLRRERGDLPLFCKKYAGELLEAMDLSGLDFTKSRFEQMDIRSCRLDGSSLIKTEWVNCKLIGDSFKEAVLFGAAFTGSDLTGSDFSGITAPVLPPTLVFPATLSWCGLDFTAANLSRVKFAGADLRGADFKGAVFGETDFSNAALDRAIFTRTGCGEAGLTKEQMRLVKIEG